MKNLYQIKSILVSRFKRGSFLFQILRKVYKFLAKLDGYRKLLLAIFIKGRIHKKGPVRLYLLSRAGNFVELQNGNKFLWRAAQPEHLLNVILSRDEHEPPETWLLKLLIKPGDIVFDLGSNFGWYAVPIVKMVGPRGLVYCFEPDDSAYRELVSNLEVNGGAVRNFRAEPMAVSNFDGEARLYSSKKLGSAFSSLIENYSSHRSHHQTVLVTKLDSYVKKNKIKKVDFIKCDVEGSELSVLEGAAGLLAQDSSPIILIEINEQDPRETFIKAEKFGYQPYFLEGEKLRRLKSFRERLPEYNFVFVKTHHLKRLKSLIL